MGTMNQMHVLLLINTTQREAVKLVGNGLTHLIWQIWSSLQNKTYAETQNIDIKVHTVTEIGL